MAYSDPCLRLPALLWHGTVLWQRMLRRPFNLQTKGFLPSYGKDRPFHSERLKRDLSSEFKVIAPNCLAMLIFNILSHNSSKTGNAHLRAKVHFFLSSTFSENEQAKQLRAHGKPWMQRVPYTFPLHKLPPNLDFFKRFFSVSFGLSEFVWIK